MSRQVGAVIFNEDSVSIEYFSQDDVRVNGQVAIQHRVTVLPTHPDYADDIAELHRAALALVENALEDFESSEPYRPDEDQEELELGMGE